METYYESTAPPATTAPPASIAPPASKAGIRQLGETDTKEKVGNIITVKPSSYNLYKQVHQYMQNKITNENISQESMFPSTDIRLKQSGNCRRKPKFPIQPPEGKKEVNISALYLV